MSTTELVPTENSTNVSKARQFDDMIDMFIRSIDVSAKSKDTYRKALKQFFLYLDNQGITTSPDRLDILQYKDYLQKEHKANTVSSYMTAVRVFYGYLESEKICPNVTHGIKGAKTQRGFGKDALTKYQAKKILNNMRRETLIEKRNYAILNLLMRTGLRTIEVVRANIADIRQSAGENLLYIQGKGRDSKDEFVVLTDATYGPIDEYIWARRNPEKSEYLFVSHSQRNRGQELTTRTIRGIVKDAMFAAGIDSEYLTAHSLRHTAVTLALLAGAELQEAQALARHSSITTTMKYAHNMKRVENAPERKIDEMLK
jgi:integrase/recombinase XerC/integrase/recombinase XerD